jgi:hypothetical protein
MLPCSPDDDLFHSSAGSRFLWKHKEISIRVPQQGVMMAVLGGGHEIRIVRSI